ncbi:hypothetical protein F5883DRAFT_677197 [Diaporthe sp. PMI_573]|nr:hypothetical protein F5883DRAFT_677197 [Diaporthaceae sp. PMI_573]
MPVARSTALHAIQRLLQEPSSQSVTGVYRSLAKVPAEFKTHPNFQAVQGDLTDGATLDFRGSDAIITLTPPKLDGSDYITFGEVVSQKVRDAVQRSGTVKRVVYVSSMGVQYLHGNGEVRTDYNCERILETCAPEVLLVRICYFMENWASAIDTIKADPPHIYSIIGQLDYKLPMLFDLHGPKIFSVLEVKEAFEQVTRKQIEVRVIEQRDLEGVFSGFLPPSLVGDFVEMTRMFLPGGFLVNEMNDLSNAKRGDESLVDALQSFWTAVEAE